MRKPHELCWNDKIVPKSSTYCTFELQYFAYIFALCYLRWFLTTQIFMVKNTVFGAIQKGLTTFCVICATFHPALCYLLHCLHPQSHRSRS